MTDYNEAFKDIPGTVVFDGTQSRLGFHLNQFCMTLMKSENREAFKADPEGYMRKYGLNDEQTTAVKSLNVLAMLRAGGNVYYLAKLAGIYKLNVQDLGAQQTGKSLEEFKAMLLAYGAN